MAIILVPYQGKLIALSCRQALVGW